MRTIQLIMAAAAVASAAAGAWGQAAPLGPPGPASVSVDEKGVGLYYPATGAPPISLPVGGPDIGPGGTPGALVYSLPVTSAPITFGDLFVTEVSGTTQYSDLIRFNQNNTLVFYSDFSVADPASDPADVPFPSSFYAANALVVPEFGVEGGINGLDYTPGVGMPGFDSTGMIVTYHIISDVPEPGTLAALSAGALVLLARRRARA